MSKKIKNYQDLLEEKARLEELLQVQRQSISSHYLMVKEELRPVANGVATVASFFGSVGRRRRGNPLINLGLDLGTELLLKRYFLVKAGWLTRTVVPLVLRKYTSKFANKFFSKKDKD